MKTYILIYESGGKIGKSNELTADQLQDARDGFISILDISDPGRVTEFDGYDWVAVELLGD
jgi:hypothetical protein